MWAKFWFGIFNRSWTGRRSAQQIRAQQVWVKINQSEPADWPVGRSGHREKGGLDLKFCSAAQSSSTLLIKCLTHCSASSERNARTHLISPPLCSSCQLSRLHEVLRNEQSPWKPSPRPVQQLRRRRGWRPLWLPRARRHAVTSVRRQWPPAPPQTVHVTSNCSWIMSMLLWSVGVHQLQGWRNGQSRLTCWLIS